MPPSRWHLGYSIITTFRFFSSQKMNCKIFFLALLTLSPSIASAQVLENFFRNNNGNSNFSIRDDIPLNEKTDDELTFEELICRDKKKFPQKISSRVYANFFECKKQLDKIEEASYIDLTYRVRWDSDRIDLYPSGIREIYICDGASLTKYEHAERKDPDWWMIVRNSIEFVTCEAEIAVESID